MVECGSDNGEGWDETWDDNDQDMNDFSAVPDTDSVPVVDEKGFRFVTANVMNQRVTAALDDLIDLYGMEIDQLILVARHFKWNQDNMQDWFTNQETLKHKIGVEFDR